MKFSVKSSDLVKELKKCIKGYEPKEESSFISFELDTQNSSLIITARSRAAFFEGTVPAKVIDVGNDEELRYYVDGLTLRQLTQIFPASPIDVNFEISDTTRQFKITYVGSQFKLAVSGDYTSSKKPETTPIASVLAADLMPAFRDLLKIASSSAETQEHQSSCIDMNFSDETLTLMATDMFAFAEIKLNYTNEGLEGTKRVLIRQSEIATLQGTFGPNEVLTLTTANGMIGYVDEDGTLALVGQTDLPPLEYRAIIDNTGSSNSILIDKGEFRYAIDTIAKLTDDNLVMLSAGTEDGTLKVSNSLGNVIEVQIEDNQLGEDFTGNLAIHVIIESLAPANTDKIRMQWGDLSALPVIRTVPILNDGSELDTVAIVSCLFIQAN